MNPGAFIGLGSFTHVRMLRRSHFPIQTPQPASHTIVSQILQTSNLVLWWEPLRVVPSLPFAVGSQANVYPITFLVDYLLAIVSGALQLGFLALPGGLRSFLFFLIVHFVALLFPGRGLFGGQRECLGTPPGHLDVWVTFHVSGAFLSSFAVRKTAVFAFLQNPIFCHLKCNSALWPVKLRVKRVMRHYAENVTLR